jgi:hypothetical protein
MNKYPRLIFLALILAFAFSLARPYRVSAASILVTVTYDGYDQNNPNICTLRMAIVAANENRQVGRCAAGSPNEIDVITFYQPGRYVLNRAGDDPANCSDADKAAGKCYYGDLDITEKLTILGDVTANPNQLIEIEASSLSNRIFHVNATGTVTLRKLKLFSGIAPTTENANPTPGRGGSIYNQKGQLVVESSVVESNIGPFGGGGIATELGASTLVIGSVIFNNQGVIGAGLLNNGSLQVKDSLIYKNKATDRGGGLNNNWNTSTALFTNVTISANDAPDGSALFSQSNVQIFNSTIASNTGQNQALLVSGTGTIKNSIVIGHANGNCLVTGTSFTSSGYNLFNGAGCSIAIASDIKSTESDLTKLIGTMNYEVSNQTMFVLPAGSPAINGGTNIGCIENDQRGIFWKRPRTNSDVCDIGSYETTAVEVLLKVFLPYTRR